VIGAAEWLDIVDKTHVVVLLFGPAASPKT
jgi:hypothetical protein